MPTKTKWRMAKLPTPDDIRALVAEKILTVAEAREILISQETDEDRDKASLQDEIKFLRELVQKLSNNSRTEIVRQIEYIEKPYRKYDWWEPYKFYCTSTAGNDTLTYSTSGSNTLLLNATGTGSTNVATTGYMQVADDFTDIKTF